MAVEQEDPPEIPENPEIIPEQPKKTWFERMDEIDWEGWEDDVDMERLPCSVGYVISCLLLPFFNGCINGFASSAIGLYFKEMGWPLWHLGLALAGGFSARLITQRCQVRFGIWTALPMSMFHLTGAILAVAFTTEEWAILVEIVCLCAFDSSMAIEGISYDTFKDYPEITDMARQATSTSLGVFTVSIALACTAGGMIYDVLKWEGLSIFHLSCQGSLLLFLLISPTCRSSFVAYFFGEEEEEEYDAIQQDVQVVPVSPVKINVNGAPAIQAEAQNLEQKLPGQGDLVIEDVEGEGGKKSKAMSLDGHSQEPEAKVKVSTVSAMSQVSSKSASRVTFSGAVEEEAIPHHEDTAKEATEGAETAEAADAVPEAAVTRTQSTDDEDEVRGIDYDQVTELRGLGDETDDALTPTSRLNVYRKGNKKPGLVLTHRMDGAVQNYEENVTSRQIRIADGHDEHEVTLREGEWAQMPRPSHLSARDSRLSRPRDSRVSRASHRKSGVRGSTASGMSRTSRMSSASAVSRVSRLSSASRASRVSAGTRISRISRQSEATLRVSRTTDRHARHRASEWSQNSGETRNSRRSQGTNATGGTMRSNMTLRSQFTSLAEAGTNFEHHFMANSALGPQIVTKTGADDDQDDFGDEEEPIEDVPWVHKGTIHPGSRLPIFLIVLCSLVTSFCYATEFGTYAVLYREYYGLQDATTPALCQTAGDFLAAIVMQVNTFSSQFDFCLPCVALWSKLAFPPYHLSWALLVWMLLNLAMMSSVLPLAIAGQVLMSCTYCLASKFSSELIFFYSRGDLKAFMKLQRYVKGFEALTAALANFLGLFLLEMVHPTTPYLVCVFMALTICVLYTNVFCGRISCRDIIVAEENRLNGGT